MRPPSTHENDPSCSTKSKDVDDWEEWEDDEVITPIDAGEQVQIYYPAKTTAPPRTRTTKPTSQRVSRVSTAKLRRLRSRHRQKAQNAKAGIRLITDMTVFRRYNYIEQQHNRNINARTGKFVDAAALRALEGKPSEADGDLNRTAKKGEKDTQYATAMERDETRDLQLSPADRPIMIGMSFPSVDMTSGRDIGPQQQTSSTMTETSRSHATKVWANDVNAPKSMWSPDTPDTLNSFRSGRAASSVYSQFPPPRETVRNKASTPPPVPVLPPGYQHSHPQKVIEIELGNSRQNEDDGGSPCTLFEEDGGSLSPPRHQKAAGQATSPDSAGSRSNGWWDHIVTPFLDKRMSFSSRKPKQEPPPEAPITDTWASRISEKHVPATLTKAARASIRAPVVRAPTPRRSLLPQTDTKLQEASRSKAALPMSQRSIRDTPGIIVTHDSASTADYPPPYSPLKKHEGAPVRYRAVFPPGHHLQTQFPPSPRPASVGLAGTMTSQGGPQTQQDTDLTPAFLRSRNLPSISEPLPVRAAGTVLPTEHMYAAAGNRHKVERQRRRHEKEEVMARRVGGFWRGRGCIPSKGCFGRPGREGRKRRRTWMAIWAGVIALIILIILLALLLARHHVPAQVPSIWVNLTDFPPMPTGVLTVVGPDNTAAKSGCTEPSTLWSCSLPKDQQSSTAPYKPNQPTLILQIQWDNDSSRAWNVPNGDPPMAITRRASGAKEAHALDAWKRGQHASGFSPNPSPPAFKEMWFLGETTDGIKSAQKAGEPTPFYISLPRSANETVPPPKLSRRESSPDIGNATFKNLIPPPDLESDGSSVPAVMMPNPIQQPVRLFDRGLPTEHYGFYTYFKRTIFLKSVTIENNTDDTLPLDQDGGCRKTEASHLVTWGETRLHVQIWTRMLSSNASSLLTSNGAGKLVRPGTMPYPVTITQDTHGGDPQKKLVWDRPINNRLQVSTDTAQALINDMAVGGAWVNPRGSGDAKFGGFDGGTGGCKCEWVNWV